MQAVCCVVCLCNLRRYTDRDLSAAVLPALINPWIVLTSPAACLALRRERGEASGTGGQIQPCSRKRQSARRGNAVFPVRMLQGGVFILLKQDSMYTPTRFSGKNVNVRIISKNKTFHGLKACGAGTHPLLTALSRRQQRLCLKPVPIYIQIRIKDYVYHLYGL